MVSAHRTPMDMARYGRTAAARGLKVIIAGAGGAAHLPGMIASHTPLPVIGVPVQSKALNGLDSLLSIVQMPAGVPVATVAIGGGRNAGLLAVKILAASDAGLQAHGCSAIHDAPGAGIARHGTAPSRPEFSMDLLESIRINLASPAILFFVLGIVAAVVKSDLRFPEPLYLGLTIYLLVAIGFKGGVAVSAAGLGAVWLPALAAMALGALIPLWTYPILRCVGRLPAVDAAAIGAHYGSVSAVTFIAAVNFLTELRQPFEAYASAFLAVMESPAIIVGVLLGKLAQRRQGSPFNAVMRLALHEALFGRSVFLLIGSLLVGFVCGQRGMDATAGFFVTPFQGVLALFLLEMGMVAARRLGDLRKVGIFLVVFGVVMPMIHGVLGIMLGQAGRVESGRRDAAGRAGGQRVVYRRAGGDAAVVAGSEPHALPDFGADHHVSVQRHAGLAAVL